MEDNHEKQMKTIQFTAPIKGQPGPEWRDNETIVRSHALKHHIYKQRYPLSVYNGHTESNHTPKDLKHYTGRYRLNPRQKPVKQTKRRSKKWQKQHAVDANDNIRYDLPAMIGGRLDPFDSFAPNLNPMSDSLILYYHQVFSMNSPILNFPRDCFLRSTPDLAWFHSILYIVSADYDVKLGVSDSSLSLYHGGASFKFINTELQEKVIRDSTISAVALVASREGICGNFEMSKVHMEGLERIVKKRGGIQNIKGIHAQIATWCDFCYSNIWNLQPRFSRLYDVPLENSVREPAKSSALGSIAGISSEMACILRSLHYVSSSSATDCTSDLEKTSIQIYNIEYDLLMLNEATHSQKIERLSNEAAALKVAAHLYLYLLLRKLPSGSPVFSELITRLRNALDKCDEVSEDSQYDRLIWRLWILFVGYAAAAEREDKWKFVKGSWAICKALHITRGAQLNSSLRATVWLEPTCERWAKSLWADCLRARRGA